MLINLMFKSFYIFANLFFFKFLKKIFYIFANLFLR